jgi:DNA polymerase
VTDIPPDEKDAIRQEFAQVVASLRAYVEWQRDTGASGFPKFRRPVQAVPHEAPAPAELPPPGPQPADPIAVLPPEPPPLPSAPPPPLAQQQPVQPAPVEPQTPTAPTVPPPPAPAPVVEPKVRLAQLVEEAQACRRCSLGSARTQAVVSRGSITPKVMFVGEAPGVDDDRQGEPFVGKAGQLLDRMIAAMGLTLDQDVYVCNVLKCRPVQRPEPVQIAACMPFLHEQIALVKPQVIVALGNTAAMAILGTKATIDTVRGQWRLYRGNRMVMSTYHPSSLLRPGPDQAKTRKTAWEDLQLVMKELGLKPPKAPVDV